MQSNKQVLVELEHHRKGAEHLNHMGVRGDFLPAPLDVQTKGRTQRCAAGEKVPSDVLQLHSGRPVVQTITIHVHTGSREFA